MKTRLNKTQWISIAGVIAVIAAGILSFLNKASIGNTYNASSQNQSGGITAGQVNITESLPAQFSEKHTIKPLGNGQYEAIIAATANENINLPNNLCVIASTDAQIIITPSRGTIRNNGISIAEVNVGGDYECIINPSANITASFLLAQNPKFFDVSFATTTP